MSTPQYFNKAWERRAFEQAEAIREAELIRNASITPRTKLRPKPEPPKVYSIREKIGHYFKPLNWTAEERAALKELRARGHAQATVRGYFSFGSPVFRMNHNG